MTYDDATQARMATDPAHDADRCEDSSTRCTTCIAIRTEEYDADCRRYPDTVRQLITCRRISAACS